MTISAGRAPAAGFLVAGLICAAPLALEAQQSGRMYRIGMLESVDLAANAEYLGAFRQGLAGFGYAEGQNVVIEFRAAEGRAVRLLYHGPARAGWQAAAAPQGGDARAIADRHPLSFALRRSGPFEQGFEAVLIDHQVDAFIAAEDPFTFTYRARILDVAAMSRLPAIHGLGEFVDAGGLMSYGTDRRDLYRRCADLSVEPPSTFELAINLKTARALASAGPAPASGLHDSVIRVQA